MDPEIGRFISEDPAKDGLNWFVYCRNNPVNLVDRDGKAVTLLAAVITIGVTALISGLLNYVLTGSWSCKVVLYGAISAAVLLFNPLYGMIGCAFLNMIITAGLEEFVFKGGEAERTFQGTLGFAAGLTRGIGNIYARQLVIALLIALADGGAEPWRED